MSNNLIIFISFIIGFIIYEAGYRTYYIRKWIKDYCSSLGSSLYRIDAIPIESASTTHTVEVSWNQVLWHKGRNDRAAIILATALTAFNEHYDHFRLHSKLIYHISTKAIKQTRFNQSLVSTFYGSCKWGVLISISYVDRPPAPAPKEELNTIEVMEEIFKYRGLVVHKV